MPSAGTCHWTGGDGQGMYDLLCPGWTIGRIIGTIPRYLS
jgi:hypothetical protein